MGYLKGMVYRVNAHTLEELKTHIEAAIANVMIASTLRNVSANMVKGVRACIHIKSTLVNICFKHEVLLLFEISSSHGGEYDVQSCLLGYTAV
jgi:hypothetical protein